MMTMIMMKIMMMTMEVQGKPETCILKGKNTQKFSLN